MINILYALNGVFRKGGTEAVVLNYFNNIDKDKFHIDFLVHGYENENLDNETHNYLKSHGSRIFYVTPRGQDFFKNKKEISEVLKNNHYDIVHSHMDAAGSFFLKEAKNAGVKVRVAHSHNTDNQINKGNAVKNFAYKVILNNARKSITKYGNLFLACSKEAGDWLFENSPYKVINNGIDISKYVYNENIRNEKREQLGVLEKKVIGHVGRFSEQKNHDFLIDIFNEICQKKDDTVLMLIGSGELEDKIKEKVEKFNLKDKVIFLENRSDVNVLLQAMDIFLLPSLFEGLPVVAIEAQASGLPCVISDTVSKDVKITENVKFISLTENSEVWSTEILSFLNNFKRKDTSKEIKSAGYDVTEVVKKLEEIYFEMLKGE